LTSVVANTIQTGAGRPVAPCHGLVLSIWQTNLVGAQR
jgi:hypothetical protein